MTATCPLLVKWWTDPSIKSSFVYTANWGIFGWVRNLKIVSSLNDFQSTGSNRFYKAQFIFIQNHSGRAYVVVDLNSNSKHFLLRTIFWKYVLVQVQVRNESFHAKLRAKKTALELIQLSLCVAQFFCSNWITGQYVVGDGHLEKQGFT